MKNYLSKISILILLVIVVSCVSEIPFSKLPEIEKKLTPLQLLLAEKAVKSVDENNPVAIHKFTADPCVLVYNDTVYVYGSNDQQQAEGCWSEHHDDYSCINTLNVFSSKDMVNWTDCGEIVVAGKNGAAKWANNSWAPAIAYKRINGKDKFFLYFADNGSGIGVLTSDSPTGPFIDPLGKQLISRSTPNTEGVVWLFDPAVFVDDDDTGYLYYGGGYEDGKHKNPKSARCVKLGDDMISLAGTPVIIDAPYLFEDSGINKINDKYVYSYCSNWASREGESDDVPPAAVIAYMVSDSPLGPFEYSGWTLKNPGAYFGAYGNNHHWMFEYKNKWYIAYHAQTVQKMIGYENTTSRSLFINEININADGTLPVQNVTMAGCTKTADFIPDGEIPAATFHSYKNVAVTYDQNVLPISSNAYLLIKNVDLSKAGSKLTVDVTEESTGIIKFVADKPFGGKVIAEINLVNGNNVGLNIPSSLKNVHDLYIVFDGEIELKSWLMD